MMPRRLIAFALLSGLVLNASAGTFDLNALKAKLNDLTRPAETKSSPGSGLDRFSASEQIESLRQALTQCAKTSVSTLARKDGFLGNPRVRIPLPENLQKADRVMHKIGLGKYSDELVTSMNRAAEAAVPEAKNLLVGAIRKMTVTDAKNILTGGDDAATRYFRKNTEPELTARFTPIIGKSKGEAGRSI